MRRHVYFLFLLVPTLACSQQDFSRLDKSFPALPVSELDENFVRNLADSVFKWSPMDTSIVNEYLPYEYQVRGTYTTHDFYKFFSVGQVAINDTQQLYIYVRNGGAGGINMFVLAVLTQDGNYCAHYEIAGLHGDGGFERLITSKFEKGTIILTRYEYDRLEDDSLKLESKTEDRIEVDDCS